MSQPRNLYRRSDAAPLDPVFAATAARDKEAELSSAALRDRLLDFYARFERRHHLPEGVGQILQLDGYRA